MMTLTLWLEHAGVLVVFALVLVEQVGLPLPTYPLLIAAGAWSAQGGSHWGHVAAAGVAACLLADLSWYAVGHRFGSRVLRTMCRLTLEPDSCVSDTERIFGRFGTRMLVVAKFIPGLGAVTTAMAGVVTAPLTGFVLYDGVGSALWAGSGVLLGVIFHDAVQSVFVQLAALGRLGGVLILTILAVFLTLKLWRRHQFFRLLRMRRISVQELFRRLGEDAGLVLIDARPHASRARDGMIPGAIALDTLLERMQQGQHSGEVVVYCACPNEATAARVARRLMGMGFDPVRPLAGGIHAWRDAGFTLTWP